VLWQTHQTILEPVLSVLVVWAFWFGVGFLFFPSPPANTVASPKGAKVVRPAKEMREHRAFCPQSIRLGQGTNVSFYFLLLRSHQ